MIARQGTGNYGFHCAQVEELYVLAIDLQESFVLEPREQSADRFDGQSEIIADLVPGHAEIKVRGAQTAFAQAPGHTQEECGKPLLGALFPEQEEHLGVVTDLFAKQPVHLLLEGRNTAAQLHETGKGNLANRGSLQDSRRTSVYLFLDGIEADELAREVKSEHLLAALLAGGEGLYRAGLDDIEGAKPLAVAKQIITPMQGARTLDDAVQPLDVVRIQAHRKAKRGEGAVLAGNPYGLERYDLALSQNSCSPLKPVVILQIRLTWIKQCCSGR